MLRFFVLGLLLVLGALTTLAAAIGGWGWWVLLGVLGPAPARGVRRAPDPALDPAELPRARVTSAS